MRHLRLPLGLLVAALALALAATPALAHEFVASASGNTKGRSEQEQKLKFGPFNISCVQKFNEKEEMVGGPFTLLAKGAVTAGSSKTLNTEVKFLKCTAAAKVGAHTIGLATAFKTAIDFEYHANGFVESGTETEEVEGKVTLAGGSIEMKVNGGPKFKCFITWPEQTIPVKAEKKPGLEYSAATYSNETGKESKKFPGGIQKLLLISNEFKGIQYIFSGEPCDKWGKEEGPENKTGTFTGEFPDELPTGNLEFL
jgi:hypothetical protein